MRIFRHDCKWTSTLVTSQRHTRRLQRRRRHRAWCASELLAPAAEVCDCATMPPTHVPLSCLCSARVGGGASCLACFSNRRQQDSRAGGRAQRPAHGRTRACLEVCFVREEREDHVAFPEPYGCNAMPKQSRVAPAV